MGSGGRIDHQSHSVGVGTDTHGQAPAPPSDNLLWHRPDSTAVHSLAMDPTTGDLLVFYHRYGDADEPSRGYPLANVTTDEWQQLTSGEQSVGRLVQQLASDPGHRPAPPPASDEAQRLIDALSTLATPATDTAMPVQRRAADAAEAEFTAEQADAAASRASAPDADLDGRSYLQDPQAFQEAYAEAQARRDRGEPVVPYMHENATGGLGAREGGRAFGVEIEFDLDPSVRDTSAARQAIARELHEAGITSSSAIHGYHQGRGRDGAGYTDAPNGWRMENDVSVNGGELVSPIMYDEPQTWANLERACEIIQRHGGRATARAGSHVTVSTADYGTNVANHNRLLNTFSAYEDTLYRLATDPARGQHRITQGNGYCTPNAVPAAGYTSVDTLRYQQGSHARGLNLQHTAGRASDRAEFRLWDATLSPAAIQTQIKLSLGMAAAAARGATGNGVHREPLGTHRANNPHGARTTGERWQATTESFRSLVDSIFHRETDRAQATALFAATRRWQRPRS